MIFHENRLLADDSHETSYLIFFKNLGKMSQNLSSAAVVIGALRVKSSSSRDASLLGGKRYDPFKDFASFESTPIHWHNFYVYATKPSSILCPLSSTIISLVCM